MAGVVDSPDQTLSIFSIEEASSGLPPSTLISSKLSENKSTTIGPGPADPVLIDCDTVLDDVPEGVRIVFETVSYTHLTLPTICSV